MENDPGHAFISQASKFLVSEYLPKIERCLEQLDDNQIWWRANSHSNSIGNLILHVCGNARQWIVCGLGSETDRGIATQSLPKPKSSNVQNLLNYFALQLLKFPMC